LTAVNRGECPARSLEAWIGGPRADGCADAAEQERGKTMTRKRIPTPIPAVTTAPSDETSSRVVARPDGFYWVADDGRQEFGPFPTAAQALAALLEGIETALEPEQSVSEVEAEIGVSEWVDPETGQPAEEVITRLEDH
jgi:hypothetical protein